MCRKIGRFIRVKNSKSKEKSKKESGRICEGKSLWENLFRPCQYRRGNCQVEYNCFDLYVADEVPALHTIWLSTKESLDCRWIKS